MTPSETYDLELLREAVRRMGRSILTAYLRECEKLGLQYLPLEHPLAGLLHDVRNTARRVKVQLEEGSADGR